LMSVVVTMIDKADQLTKSMYINDITGTQLGT